MKLVADIEVMGFQPVPWSVPEICRAKNGRRFTKSRGRNNPAEGRTNINGWQAIVADAASEAMAKTEPVRGPVRIDFTFYIKAGDGAVPGEPCFMPLKWNKKTRKYTRPNFKGYSLPDLTNLEKGTEDALEEIVMVNDFQVVGKTSAREWGHHGGCRVQVWLLDEAHEGETHGDDADCVESTDGGSVRPKRAHGKRVRCDDVEPKRQSKKRRAADHREGEGFLGEPVP